MARGYQCLLIECCDFFYISQNLGTSIDPPLISVRMSMYTHTILLTVKSASGIFLMKVNCSGLLTGIDLRPTFHKSWLF